MATDPGHHQLVSTWLGATGLVGSVTAVVDSNGLCAQMRNTPRQLCILVPEEHQHMLPSCLWDFEATKVLVLTTNRKTGKQSSWLEQGAADVVSLKKPLIAQHVISRLVQDCIQQMQRAYFEQRTAELKQEVAALKQLMKADRTGGIANASTLIDASVFAETSTLQPSNDAFSADATQAMPKRVMPVVAHDSVDAATGLPTRMAATERFELELDSQRLTFDTLDLNDTSAKAVERRTVMLLQFVDVANNQEDSVVDQNLQDLILCRAANTLQTHLQSNRLLGRTDRQSLLVLFKGESNTISRHAANWVRERLGTLDGLIEPEKNVRIYTMNLASNIRLTADEIVCRLEAHAARQVRKTHGITKAAMSPDVIAPK